ncbi:MULTISPECIES: hypothetical protein [Mycobacteriales]|uniref:hypothetical protein n=1 Tax=Mycobacteriales TaxID=85007 RepID=UPI0002FCF0A8|nr:MULTISPECIES: hypothetical protein [Mycobacteriales]
MTLAVDEFIARMHEVEGYSSALQAAETNQQRRAGIPAVVPVSPASPDEREPPPE